MRSRTEDRVIAAAGGVVWRPSGDDGRSIEIAVVHRERHDDWSLPKGHVDAGEHPLQTACREVVEETGLAVVAGRRGLTTGYEVDGEVPDTDLGHLTMLELPGDEFVSIELVHDPDGAAVDIETRLSHLVVQVDDMEQTLTELAARGIDAGAPTSPDGSDDIRTAWIVDPDGNRIELVQWPTGHADGMTAADFAE